MCRPVFGPAHIFLLYSQSFSFRNNWLTVREDGIAMVESV